ncbi:sensor histidine kinase [Nonomuraea sp. NPDC049714]|uniref:sensor histidine kinase n=1 Tax=Nonomuraea sp. NPDC049714 TaxID=3364357 RepID=UPI0037A462B0
MRQTVRLRLTALYSGLFLVATVLLALLFFGLLRWLPAPPAPVAPGGGALSVPEPFPDSGRLLQVSLITLGVMAVASTWLGWVVAGKVLRPLGHMTATVRRITADRLDRRLAASGPDDELKELADTFDDLLDRLEAAFTAQRRFVANASHELRTPLTVQRAMAEVALADPEADLRSVLVRLLAAGQHQERLIEALLTLARGQQGLARREPLDLADLAGQGAPAPFLGDRALMERLVANLLDNARRYNVPGGWVSVDTFVRHGHAVLVVANSGPVIPPDRIGALLEPFQRLEAGRKASGDGLGLGLSIVAAIVDAHQGHLDLRPHAEGGLEVTVTLPSA